MRSTRCPAEADPSPRGSGRDLTHEEFAGLFAKASRKLRCIALAIVGEGAHADDVVQEAAMIALTKLDQFRQGTSFEAWMGQIVRYAALNESRRRAKHGATGAEGAPPAYAAAPSRPEPAPVDEQGNLVRNQAAFDDEVAEALGQLDETARACLLLRTTMDLAYKEIAELLDIPEGTAMSHVHRSRRRLRELLGDRGDRS